MLFKETLLADNLVCVLFLQKIDKFFTKEILYLITDHGQEEDYKLSKSKVGDEGDVSTPSPFAFTPGSGIGTPPESTNASTKSKPATSRGSAILAKIRGSNSQVKKSLLSKYFVACLDTLCLNGGGGACQDRLNRSSHTGL